MEIDRFHELLLLKRAMSIREKSQKYSKLTEEIRQVGKTDRLRMVELRKDRKSLKYNPSNPPDGSLNDEEMKSRCEKLMETLSELSVSLLTEDKIAEAEFCDHCHEVMKILSIQINPFPDNPLPIPPTVNSLYSCVSHPIQIDEGHPIRVDRILRCFFPYSWAFNITLFFSSLES